MMFCQYTRELNRTLVPVKIELDQVKIIGEQWKVISFVSSDLFYCLFAFDLTLFLFSLSFTVYLLMVIKKNI
jgi:hypothetical protein